MHETLFHPPQETCRAAGLWQTMNCGMKPKLKSFNNCYPLSMRQQRPLADNGRQLEIAELLSELKNKLALWFLMKALWHIKHRPEIHNIANPAHTINIEFFNRDFSIGMLVRSRPTASALIRCGIAQLASSTGSRSFTGLAELAWVWWNIYC